MSTSAQGPEFDEQLTPVRWGVLGASNFALTVSLPGMKRGPLTQLAALASRDIGKATAAARSLGIPRAYGSYDELLDDPEIDAIYNPLPNHLHVKWTARAARAGKHVLCEKPIALSAEDAEALVDVQRETGKLIAEAFMIRNHPQWQQVRDWVRRGKIGELVSVQAAFSYYNRDAANIRNKKAVGGGALYDIGCYAVNTSRFLFGREPVRAMALVDHDPEFGTDRLTSGLLDYGGAHLTFTCSTQAVPYQRVNAFGTKGRIELEIPFNAPADQPCKVWLDDGSTLNCSSAKVISFPAVDQYHLQSEAFSRAVRAGGPVENSIEVAVGNMRVIDALFRSAESGRWEKISPAAGAGGRPLRSAR
ncbi:NAD-binding protein [Sorangium cellulosum]|uniref:NAD-binding protein n=1 Tax=Sorangium cellulosum TaxID=56 RepID=A0A150PWA1_SORCE|nr:Gfo/Idh/MocA family oxidoreductase [Sorangium cellulosum]KYF60027.1 NAD-binding protein [Sorangium cellulosum]